MQRPGSGEEQGAERQQGLQTNRKKWFEITLRLVWRSPGFKDHSPEPSNCNKSGVVVLRIRVHNDNSLMLYLEKQVINEPHQSDIDQ